MTRDGLFEVVDTNWDGNGNFRVTVSERIGQSFSDYPFDAIAKARRLAKGSVPMPHLVKRSTLVNRHRDEAGERVTFLVSR